MATDTNNRAGESEVSPPYVSWTTVKNTIEKMAREGGVPSQVDRSYLNNLPGSTQTQLIAAMKWLGLINDDMKPTDLLEGLVEQDESDRKETVKAVLGERYPAATSLPGLATQGQLEKTFRDLGVSGSTLRKAVAFFLGAAKYADLALSPHFKTPRGAPAGERKPRKPARPAGPSGPTGATGPTGMGEAFFVRGALHPLIQGLIQELPPPNAAFPKTKQEDWLELAKVTFRLIYKTDVEPEPPSFLSDPEDGESD